MESTAQAGEVFDFFKTNLAFIGDQIIHLQYSVCPMASGAIDLVFCI